MDIFVILTTNDSTFIFGAEVINVVTFLDKVQQSMHVANI